MVLRKSFGLFFVVLITTNINAEPSASITWTEEQAADLSNISMLKMQMHNRELWIPRLMKELDKNSNLKLDNNLDHGGVVYDSSENIISLHVNLIGAPTEAQCTNVLSKYKKILSPYTVQRFKNIGYQSQSRQKGIDKETEILFEFAVGVSDTPGQSGKSITCSSRMDSNVPSIRKYYW